MPAEANIHPYLESIQAKTGKTVETFRALAAEKGFSKYGEALAWLKAEHGLGHGHAMFMAKQIMEPEFFAVSDDQRVETLFSGKKAKWRPLYDILLVKLQQLGPDVEIDASTVYVSFVRGGKKFAIAQPSTLDRFDLGIKLKGEGCDRSQLCA